MIRRAMVLAFGLVMGVAACEGARSRAELVLEIEGRFPGSKIEIEDLHEGGVRRVEVTIRSGSFEEDNLAAAGRDVAEMVQRRYRLRAETDTVAVAFQMERQSGVLATSSRAFFVYPVSELGAGD